MGNKAIDYLRSNIGNSFGNNFDKEFAWNSIRETFILSCLLHDIGHSPFSHTGETFYNASTIFENELHDLIQSLTFDEEVKNKGTGKSHEAMSAIISITLLENMNYEFKKESLSVIENITYANDLERRWIQSNPTILK